MLNKHDRDSYKRKWQDFKWRFAWDQAFQLQVLTSILFIVFAIGYTLFK